MTYKIYKKAKTKIKKLNFKLNNLIKSCQNEIKNLKNILMILEKDIFA
jgi:hypothetical protein